MQFNWEVYKRSAYASTMSMFTWTHIAFYGSSSWMLAIPRVEGLDFDHNQQSDVTNRFGTRQIFSAHQKLYTNRLVDITSQ